VIPDDASDVVTPVDGVYDMPSTVADSSPGWPTPGSTHSWVWSRQDLAVLVADAP